MVNNMVNGSYIRYECMFDDMCELIRFIEYIKEYDCQSDQKYGYIDMIFLKITKDDVEEPNKLGHLIFESNQYPEVIFTLLKRCGSKCWSRTMIDTIKVLGIFC